MKAARVAQEAADIGGHVRVVIRVAVVADDLPWSLMRVAAVPLAPGTSMRQRPSDGWQLTASTRSAELKPLGGSYASVSNPIPGTI